MRTLRFEPKRSAGNARVYERGPEGVSVSE